MFSVFFQPRVARAAAALFALLALVLSGSARAQTLSGASSGFWNLPVGNVAGLADGDVRIGQTGPTVFRFEATLVPPAFPQPTFQGVVDGFLESQTATLPSYRVRGRWFADPVTGEGYFRCVVITLGANPKIVGRIGGKFSDPPDYNVVGTYAGSWVVGP